MLDTAALARSVLGEDEVPDCKLATLAGFFGARTLPCHRALADARATADVLQALLGRLAVGGRAHARRDQRLIGAAAPGGTLLGQPGRLAPVVRDTGPMPLGIGPGWLQIRAAG